MAHDTAFDTRFPCRQINRNKSAVYLDQRDASVVTNGIILNSYKTCSSVSLYNKKQDADHAIKQLSKYSKQTMHRYFTGEGNPF